jgi:hypothetical protein
MKYTSEAVSQTRNIVIQPVTTCQDDIVDFADEVFMPSNSILKSSRPGFLLSFDEESDVGL